LSCCFRPISKFGAPAVLVVLTLTFLAAVKTLPAGTPLPPEPGETTLQGDGKPPYPEPRAGGRTLRILVPDWPGARGLSQSERDLLAQYADSENLDQAWIPVSTPDALLTGLTQNQADMAVSIFTGDIPVLDGQVLYTLPWGVSSRQLIGRAGNNSTTKSVRDLATRQIALKQSSPVWPLLEELKGRHAGMQLSVIPEHTGVNTVLERVNSGRYDLAVLDSSLLPADLQFHYNLEVVMDLTEDRYMSWAVRADARTLHESLNKFLNKKHLELEMAERHREDFPSIQRRKLLRLVTFQSPVNYFYDRGRFKGFEYELVKRFAEKHGMRLDVVIADSYDAMREMLNKGMGDIIAASVPEGRYAQMADVKTTRPYNYASPVLVGRNIETIIDARALSGRTVLLASESPYRATLQRLREQGIDLNIMVADTDINTETLLFRVGQGIYDLTVIGSHELNVELSRQLNLKAHFSLSDPQPLVWAVRQANPRLLDELNEFIEVEYRKGFYNVIYSRYIDKPGLRRADSSLIAQLDQLSPYDEIVHKYADRYSFDWRLIVAQMYQESRFNPMAVSDAGAEGLMQLLPATAAMIGIQNLNDPDTSIHGGVRYLDYLRGQFEDSLPLEDRTWFTLASYNAGYNRVRQARELAERMNLDSSRWFNNVEIAMLRLARPYMKDGEVARVCRCGQAVVYVREIRTLYNNYLRLTQSVKAAARLSLAAEES
jgi:membrane-bound lytic murein transglycosylase F